VHAGAAAGRRENAGSPRAGRPLRSGPAQNRQATVAVAHKRRSKCTQKGVQVCRKVGGGAEGPEKQYGSTVTFQEMQISISRWWCRWYGGW